MFSFAPFFHSQRVRTERATGRIKSHHQLSDTTATARESGSKRDRVREQVSQQDKERAIKHSELMQRPHMEAMCTVKSAADAILKELKIAANLVVAFDMQDPVISEGARRADYSMSRSPVRTC